VAGIEGKVTEHRVNQAPDALYELLSRTRHMLFIYYARVVGPAGWYANELRSILKPESKLPENIWTTTDPFEILSFAAEIDSELATRIEAELAKLERSGAESDVSGERNYPSDWSRMMSLRDPFDACRESGRSVSVVSNNSAGAVNLYLTETGLERQVGLVVARTSYDPALLIPCPHMIEQVIITLNARPSACTVVGHTPADIRAAHLAGANAIGHPHWSTRHKPEMLAAAGAEATVESMSEFASKIKSGPPPG
jgi:phosphoglycolate phosphatase